MSNRFAFFAVFGMLMAPGLQVPSFSQEADSRPPKRFEWVDSRAGNCHLSGVLTLYPDGRAVWSATTWTDSTSNKDIWHTTLRVMDSQNQELFGFGVWDSPPMDSPPNGGQYNWSREGQFPPAFFDAATTATSQGAC